LSLKNVQGLKPTVISAVCGTIRRGGSRIDPYIGYDKSFSEAGIKRIH
jgi:hypothetical protein